jgi:phage terminase Nu1 subunit (DNA packaging protein)
MQESKRLDSWKEIATFLQRGVRTVQRWERSEGLPVRRHHHLKRGSVYALQSDIAAWLATRTPTRNGRATADSALRHYKRLHELTQRQASLTDELRRLLLVNRAVRMQLTSVIPARRVSRSESNPPLPPP